MTMLQDIKQEQILARKVQDTITANILTTLIGEAEMIGKNDGNRETSDVEVIALIKKFVKNIDETVKHLEQNEDPRASIAQAEKIVLAKYLPIQLSDVELRNMIEELAVFGGLTSPKDMGKLMSLLKEKADGQYDGKVASMLAKSVLAG